MTRVWIFLIFLLPLYSTNCAVPDDASQASGPIIKVTLLQLNDEDPAIFWPRGGHVDHEEVAAARRLIATKEPQVGLSVQ